MMLWETEKNVQVVCIFFEQSFQGSFGSKVLSDFSTTAPIMIPREFRKFIVFFLNNLEYFQGGNNERYYVFS